MPSRKDCLDEIAKKTGRSKADVEDILNDIFERAEEYQHDGLGPDEAYARARDERIKEIYERAALDHRAAIMDGRKQIARRRYYADTAKAITALPLDPIFRSKAGLEAKLGRQAARLALEAKLVGTNLPLPKGRLSVDAQFVALRDKWSGLFERDLEAEHLEKIFASRHLEGNWVDELFELNGGRYGNPGVTKDAQALAIAKIIQKYQRVSIVALNGEGAWVRSYSNYITRTSHDPDSIRAAGPEKWIADTLPRLNLRRTFGTADRQRARDALFEMWTPMMQGDHFDYGKPVDEPLYPTTAKTASASRELHFKTGKDWLAYNEQYGVHNATHTVVQSLVTAARRTALMKEFGTRPREAYEADKQYLLASLQAESKGKSTRLGALEQAFGSPGADAAAKAKIAAEMETLRGEIAVASAKFDDFKSWQIKLDNRFAQIDGTSMKPVSRAMANTVANIMSAQQMSKLGNILATHFASLPTKAAEARYWGMPFGERFGGLFRGFTQGAEGSAKREALDLTLVGFANRLGHMMNTYDVADAPAGFMTRWNSRFFKLTGVSAVIDNQRGDFEAMAAAHLGGARDQAWVDIGHKKQRVLQQFGVAEAEWKALHGVDWTTIDGRTYLFPSDVLKLSDDQVRAYLKEAPDEVLGRREPTADDVAKAREDLALRLATAFSDRSGYAIPMPSARIRAMLFGKHFEPGTAWNMALKLFWQFKIWPADMITRAWEREIYGTIGDGRLDRVAGLVEMAVGAIIFGVAAEGIRDLIKGQDPMAKLGEHPFAAIAAGAQRSGMGSIVGDYLLGQFDRHGLSAAANLLGPTFGQIDELAELLHAGGRTKDGMLSGSAMRERATTAMKMVKNNTPFMNLWATHHITDVLIWHRLQEWINPGYLARSERRQRDLQGTQFIVSPAKTDAWITGRRGSPL
jgi:hypothetical protein